MGAKRRVGVWAFTQRLPCVLGRFGRALAVLSKEPEGSAWAGERGIIDKARIQQCLPTPDEDCIIFVCGPVRLL
jgi:hypothetical protein